MGTATLPEDDLTTSDMDFDPVHAICNYCYPKKYYQFLPTKVSAVCGKETDLVRDYPRTEDGTPLNPCPECLEIFQRTRRTVCGH